MKISQRTGNAIIIIIVILINIWLMTSGWHSGRSQDYNESQNTDQGSP